MNLPHSRYVVITVLLLLGGLSACVAPTPRSDVPVASVNVKDIQQAGANNETVRWGGTVAKVENTKEGTSLQLVSRPLSSWGRPVHNDQTYGRFIATVDRFLDPEIIKAGKDVTLIGVVTDISEGKIGETAYRFPVVAVSQIKLWRPQPKPQPYPYPFHGWHDEFWHDSPLHDYHWPHRH